MQRPGVAGWLAVGWFGFLFLPWNAIGGQGFLAFNWVAAYPLDARVAPAAVQLVYQGALWLLPLAAALALPLFTLRGAMSDRVASRLLIVSGALGVATIAAVAAAIDIGGWTWPAAGSAVRPAARASARAWLRRACGRRRRADVRLPRSCVARLGPAAMRSSPARSVPSVALVGLFTLYPLSRLFVRAFVDRDGQRVAARVDRAYRIEPGLGLRRRRVEYAAARRHDRARPRRCWRWGSRWS